MAVLALALVVVGYVGANVSLSAYDRLWQAIGTRADFLVWLALATGSDPDGCDYHDAYVYQTDPIAPVVAAIASRHSSAVKILLDAGANPNFRFSDGSTPLEMAMNYEDQLALQSLLEHGADPLASVQGKTILALAIEQGRTRDAKLMIEALERRDVHWKDRAPRAYPWQCARAAIASSSGG